MEHALEDRSSFKSYLQLVGETTQRRISQEDFDDFQRQNRVLREQSLEIACRLEEGGVPAFDEEADVALVGLRTGEVRHFDAFRQINFIPSVAQKKRGPRLRVLEYYLDQQKGRKSHRMWTFNTGPRSLIGNVRQRVTELHRNLSRLASELRQGWGVDIIFRSTELGSMARQVDGLATFHVHAHCLVQTPYLNDWSGMLEWVQRRWREIVGLSPNGKWKVFEDSGKIFNPRELCKYCVKPTDVLQLNSAELCELQGQMFRLHLVQFSGSLQDVRRRLDDRGVRPVRRSRGDSWEWDVVPSWNRLPESVYEAIALTKNAPIKPTPKDNRLLGLLTPAFFFDTLAEPAALVARYNGNFHALVSEHGRVRETCRMVEAAAERCAARRALGGPVPYTVHNGSETVRRERDTGVLSTGPPGKEEEIPF